MKKLLILLFILISFDTFAVEKETTFTSEVFNEAQKAGKTVVINSWNKTCGTCSAQIKVLQEAEKEFNDVLFLSFEQIPDDDAGGNSCHRPQLYRHTTPHRHWCLCCWGTLFIEKIVRVNPIL